MDWSQDPAQYPHPVSDSAGDHVPAVVSSLKIKLRLPVRAVSPPPLADDTYTYNPYTSVAPNNMTRTRKATVSYHLASFRIHIRDPALN